MATAALGALPLISCTERSTRGPVFIRAAFALVCGLLASCAAARPSGPWQIPPLSTGPGFADVRVVNGLVEAEDSRTGAPLAVPQGITAHESPAQPDQATPAVRVQTQPDGYDLIYRYTNRSDRDLALGRLQAGVFNLGPSITYRDFAISGAPVAAETSTYIAPGLIYPMWIYSPVAVFGNSDVTVGVSLQYPVLEYKHQVRVMLHSPGGRHTVGPAGRGWVVEFRLGNFGDERGLSRIDRPARLAPGESRTYVVSVRFADASDAWQRTLLPYRGFFNAVYGGVRYVRDPRPVNCVVLASNEHVTPDNLLGFGQMPENRPDVGGWTIVTDEILAPRGWPRSMVWMTGGNYQYQRSEPFHFATRWLTTPKFAEATSATRGLGRVPRAGRELGLWWTESQWIMRDGSREAPFDFTKSGDVAAARRELDLALQTGATMIGLDTFHDWRTPLWEHYTYLRELQRLYPGVRFITEPVACDVLHTLAPTFFQWWARVQPPTTGDEVYPITTPHYLADFLNPGHETWAGMRYVDYRQFHGHPPTTAEIVADIQRAASWGYVPAFAEPIDLTDLERATASESWLVTVPEDLQNAGRSSPTPRRSGPALVGSAVRAERQNTAVAGARPARPARPAHAEGALAREAIRRARFAAPSDRR